MTSDDLSSLSPRFVYSTQSGAIRCNRVQSDAIRTASLHGLPGWHQDAKLGPVCVGHVLNAFTRILKDKSVFAAYPRIRTPACVYAPPAYTHPCLRTYAPTRVYAPSRTCVYAPTPAYKHVCVNAASGAYTHLPAYTHPTLRPACSTQGRDERHVTESTLFEIATYGTRDTERLI